MLGPIISFLFCYLSFRTGIERYVVFDDQTGSIHGSHDTIIVRSLHDICFLTSFSLVLKRFPCLDIVCFSFRVLHQFRPKCRLDVYPLQAIIATEGKETVLIISKLDREMVLKRQKLQLLALNKHRPFYFIYFYCIDSDVFITMKLFVPSIFILFCDNNKTITKLFYKLGVLLRGSMHRCWFMNLKVQWQPFWNRCLNMLIFRVLSGTKNLRHECNENHT